jgi:hypothetical protein
MHADGADGLEAFGAGHVWEGWTAFCWLGVEDQHAEADEGVAEEDGDGEEDHDEEDVDFLADIAVGERDCEVLIVVLANVSQL